MTLFFLFVCFYCEFIWSSRTRCCLVSVFILPLIRLSISTGQDIKDIGWYWHQSITRRTKRTEPPCVGIFTSLTGPMWPKAEVWLWSMCFTFEEDKFAIRSLVGGVDARRQTLPELVNLHGVTLLHLVVPQAPEPSLLQHHELTVTAAIYSSGIINSSRTCINQWFSRLSPQAHNFRRCCQSFSNKL